MNVIELLSNFWQQLPPFARLTLPFISVIAAVGTWRLYAKADQKGYTIFIPIVNLTTFMKIIGRPVNHALFLLIPGYNLYFLFKILIELCQSFGKSKTIDYVLACSLNILYILNLGLAYDTKYHGPAYQEDPLTESSGEEGVLTQFA
jgi:lipopolysaccharide export LptBFGC system permease protein LptF